MAMAKVEQLKAMQSEAEQSCITAQQRAATSLESRLASNRDRATSANSAIRSIVTDASMSPLLCLHSLSATVQADAECEARIRSSFIQDQGQYPPSNDTDSDGLPLFAACNTNEPNDVRADYSAEARDVRAPFHFVDLNALMQLARLRHALATAWTRTSMPLSAANERNASLQVSRTTELDLLD
jgi:hypothetical protein